MNNKNITWLSDISEQEMLSFFNKYAFGCVDSVIKYYDEAYNGYVFRVKLNSVVPYFPTNGENTFILGSFGVVTDVEDSLVPLRNDNFSQTLKSPLFFKDYITFIGGKNQGKKINGRSFMKEFEFKYAWFMAYDKNRKLMEIKRDSDKQQEILNDIKQIINNEDKGKEC